MVDWSQAFVEHNRISTAADIAGTVDKRLLVAVAGLTASFDQLKLLFIDRIYKKQVNEIFSNQRLLQ